MKRYFIILLLLSACFAQRTVQDSQSTTTSGAKLDFPNEIGAVTVNFEVIITGSPATVSIPFKGCMRGGTCDTLITSTATASSNVQPNSNSVTYDYYEMVPSWTGGTAVSVTLNRNATTARGGAPKGTTINPTNNAIPKRSNGTTFVDSACTDNGTTVACSEPIQGNAGTSGAPGFTSSADANTGFSAGSAGQLFFVTSSATSFMSSNGLYRFGSANPLGWSSNTNPISAGADVGISRDAPGVLDLGNGTAGDSSGTLKLANVKGITAFLTSLYTNSTTTFSNVTGLSFPVAASQNYKIRCDLDYQSSATTADVKVQWTGPASPTFLTYDLVTEVTGSTLSASVNPATATTTGAFSTSLSESGTPTINTNFPMTLTMTLINGVNAGTVQLQAAATGVGTISILPGSCVVTQ